MLKLKLQYTLATWCEELTHLKRPWCWERLKAGGDGDDRGWDGWMASPSQRTWVWVNSGSWLWTGRPGVLQSMGSKRFIHNWAIELNWMELILVQPESFSFLIKDLNPFIINHKKYQNGGSSWRWQRTRTGRPLSPQQIHQKNISMLSKFHKTTSECRQRISGTQESSPLSSKGGTKKYKR